MSKFNELPISDEIIRAVSEMGYEEATPIQASAIPAILEGHDVLGLSNTGTGKTAAFGIPAIKMINDYRKHPKVMIICPTRELVEQVATELRKFSKYKEGIKIAPIYGGQPIDRQIQLLKRGCAIVVGTPGRIMDHLRRRTLRLTECDMVILDEADEMLNMGFKEDIEEILKSLPEDKHPQTILFSATMPNEIMKITKKFQVDPVKVQIKSSQRTIDTVDQYYYEVPRGKKLNALRVLLNHYDPDLCMIFCNTKRMVDELCEELNHCGIRSVGLHGDMKQAARDRVMYQFRERKCSILIATDVAARGIDVDDIALVVNFDIPQDHEYYIHRVGRTGRAGKKGKAITLLSAKRQLKELKEIMYDTKTKIVKRMLPTSEQLEALNRKNFINEVLTACNEGINEDSMEIANDLLAEGIAVENLISALISMNYKNEIIDIEDKDAIRRYSESFDAIRLHLSIGKNCNIKTGNVVAAIIEECGINAQALGRIDIRSNFTLVDVDAAKVDIVLEKMQGAQIRGHQIEVQIDEAPKRKSDASGYNKKGGKRNKRSDYSAKKNRGTKDKKEHRRKESTKTKRKK
ncbi:MAG: DEAD/DEAH box helicase [Erysipelotrichaceae bacterium]|nr:DEAD/DEAH box helicase [Erysipelotrichaceae bacterium]